MKLFWILKPADRAKLMQLQDKLYGTRLDIVAETPPWKVPPTVPEIPVHTGMTQEDLGEFISQAPDHQEKAD